MPQKTKETPMMKQYQAIKDQYPDAFLFYRIGDFYELFNDDAIKGAQLLELTLTARNKNADDPIPMAGVPHHAAQGYIDILVDQGYKVAICEQVEDPKLAVGMVKREVIQLVTPGTKMDVKPGDSKSNNYLAAVVFDADAFGFAYADLSTGELKTTHLRSKSAVQDELAALQVKEVVVPADLEADTEWLQKGGRVVSRAEGAVTSEASFVTQNLEDESEQQATTLLMDYLVSTQKRALGHMQPAVAYTVNAYLELDADARLNLDILRNSRTGHKKDTLLDVLDYTKTAMGGRLLKQWLDRPLRDLAAIRDRQDQVASLLENFFARSELQELLTKVYDLERLAGRVAFGSVNGRDLLQLTTSLAQVPGIVDVLSKFEEPVFARVYAGLDPVSDVRELIDAAIEPEAPISVTDGGVIRAGYDAKLDEYREAMANSKQWLADLEAKEREETGIHNLKIRYNKLFGYYIEVTKANLDKVPEERYTRKQTLTNAERFSTPELKEKETLILGAQEHAVSLEYELFQRVREQVQEQITRIQKLAQLLAGLDVLQSFATAAESQNLVRPLFHEQSRSIAVTAARHPVVERVIGASSYIPNSVMMDDSIDVLLITGPNMSGKSTYMRSLALLVIMAQVGSFVAAEAAELPVFDRIFTRIGAADDLASGQSTFMVEMMEANAALMNATPKSLVLFDEIGRGTATYDGMALAQGIIEYLHNTVHAKTLFSTHYHELTALADELPRLENVHVGAVEENGTLVFLHKMMAGPADKSYGIHVAKLAGLPSSVLARSEVILKALEAGSATAPAVAPEEKDEQMSLFVPEPVQEKQSPVLKKLAHFDLMAATPLDAMNLLYDLQKQLKKK